MNIKSLCLGILYFEDATGYEINKYAAEGRFRHFIEASYGSIYPALTKLTQEALVTCRQEPQEGKPTRKIYSITEKGRRELIGSLSEGPKDDVFKSEFLFICLFANVLGPAHMKQLTDKKIQSLEKTIDGLEQCAQECPNHETNFGAQFAIGYGKALHEAALSYVKNNRQLLEINQTQSEILPSGHGTTKSKAAE